MAISAAKLLVQVGADTSGLTKGLRDSESALTTFASKSLKAGTILSASVTAPAILAAKSIFNVGAALEQSTVAFSTMLGSAEAAGAYLNELRDFAAATPFEFTELQDAAKRMIAFGFEAQKVIPMLTDIGDAAAGLGLGADGINRITLALGQMQAKEKVSAQEMMQLTESGIPAWRYLAEAMGVSTAEVMKMSEQGLIPAGEAIDYILAGMKQDFGGLMAEQAKTATGQLSNLSDDLNELAADLSTFILPIAKEGIDQAREVVKTLNDLSPETKELIVKLAGIAAVTGPAMMGLSGVANAAGGLISMGKGAAGALSSLGAMSGILGPIALAAGSALAIWLQWNDKIVKTNREGAAQVSAVWSDWFDKQEGSNLQDMTNNFTDAWKSMEQDLRSGGFASIFIDQTKLAEDAMKKFEVSARYGSKSYAEYIEASIDAGAATGLLHENYRMLADDWRTNDKALAYLVQQLGLATEAQYKLDYSFQDSGDLGAYLAQGYQVMSQMALEASDSTDGLGKRTSIAFQAMASSADETMSTFQALVTAQDKIKQSMQNWTEGAANQARQALGGLAVTSDQYLQGLQAIDTVMGTNLYQQQTLTNSMNELGEEYQKTGDTEAFQAGLEQLKEEGLKPFQEDLEEATQKAQDLYDQLLTLPQEIKIRIGFEVEDYPTLGGSGGAGNGTTTWSGATTDYFTPQATGGDWLVTQPTFFLAGEAGPERATFTPVGQDSSSGDMPQIIIQATVDSHIDMLRLAQEVAYEIRRRKL